MPFNAENFDNSMTAGRLSDETAATIANSIQDQRLTNPPGDYFQIELENETVEIPKQEKIGIEKDDGAIKVTRTEDYIRQLLTDADERD